MVITTAGPFEKYGQTLVKLCAEEGVDYADSAPEPGVFSLGRSALTDRAAAAVSGESDFLRAMVAQHDATAQQTGARIVVHCGNDCIPWDLTVFEMHKHAQSKGAELVEVQTFGEFGDSFGASGGTLTTAIYQLGKQRSAAKPDFDPLLRTRDGRKSDSLTKITNPKKDVRSAATRIVVVFASVSAPPPPPPHEVSVRGPPLPAGLGGRVRAVWRAVDHGPSHGQLRTTLQRAARVCAL